MEKDRSLGKIIESPRSAGTMGLLEEVHHCLDSSHLAPTKQKTLKTRSYQEGI